MALGLKILQLIIKVSWLEGNDPDCTDDVLGGQFKVDMLFEIIG